MKKTSSALFAVLALVPFAAQGQVAIGTRPSNGWVNDAAQMLDAKEWRKGTDLTRAALSSGDLTPESNAAALNNLCIGLTGLVQYNDAMKACLQAIEMQPRQWQSYNNLANIYFYLGQYDKALAEYYKALSFRAGSGVLLQNIRIALDRRNSHPG